MFLNIFIKKQRGLAGMATLLLLLVAGIVATTIYFASATRARLASEQITADALAQAKEALIGYAAAVNTSGLPGVPPPPNPRPGELPCPNLALTAGEPNGIATTPCSPLSARIGYFPWKTLGIPPLRDGSGNLLWYAVSDTFKNNPRTSGSVLNSDTLGDFAITGSAPANTVIAIVFAPGKVTGAQDRDNTVATCATTNASAPRKLCAAHFLEGENANGPTPDNTFETGLPTDSFNDRLLPITSDALFSVVNVRVAKEAITALENYRAASGYYPFANAYGSIAPYNCSSGMLRGRFPITTAGPPCNQASWPLFPNNLPSWFSENNWNIVTHYAISKACGEITGLGGFGLEGIVSGLLCGLPLNIGIVNTILGIFGFSFADEPLSVAAVTGGGDTRVLVIVSGRALGLQTHSCTTPADCMEDGANSDGNANYVKPSRFPASNDRMALCSPSAPCPAVP